MARKNEGIIDILCLLPWQISTVLALVVYLLSHFLIPTIAFENLIFKAIAPNAPLFGNIVGTICLLCAIYSAANSFLKSRRLDTQKNLDSIRALGWKEFEELIGEAFRRKGFSVRENEGSGPDGGVDLLLFSGKDKYLVQCKQWRTYNVGVKVIRELFGVMAATGAVGGFVVVSGHFTKEAIAFAQSKNIKLIGGPELWEMIQSVKTVSVVAKGEPARNSVKMCPGCGKEMVLRTARRGPQTGQKFWGCTGYPVCKSTLPLSGNA